MIKNLKNKILKTPNAQKILKNIGWLLFDKFLQFGVGIFVSIWVARYLGPESYGIYSYAIAFVTLFGVTVELGLRGIVVRELIEQPQKENQILGSAFFMILFASFFVWGLATLSVYMIRSEDMLTFGLVTITSAGFIFRPFQVITYYFESRVESKFIVYAKNTSFLISSLLKIILIITDQNLIAFAVVGLLDMIIISIGLFVVYRMQKMDIRQWRWNFQISKSLLKDSYPLILSGVFATVFMKIDQIMLRDLTTDFETGIYSVSVKLTEVWYFIPSILQISFFPSIIESQKISIELLNRKIHQFFSVLVVLTFLIAIPTTLLSDTIVLFLYGEEYRGAVPMLCISIWALLFVCFGVGRLPYLIATNQVKYSFYAGLIGATTNILLNFVLIPKYGGIGSAWATLISYFCSAYGSNFLFKDLRPLGRLMNYSMIKPKFYDK